MKSLVIFFLCCIVLQTRIITLSARAVREKSISLDEAKAQCIKDLSLDEEHILKTTLLYIRPENDDKLNKFAECAWKKVKLQDDNGRIVFDALRDHLNDVAKSTFENEEEEWLISAVEQRIRRAVAFCQHNPPGGNSHGQIAVKTLNCVMKKLKELFQLEDE